MNKILIVLFLFFFIAETAFALAVRLSLDGNNPAPDAMDVTPGELIGLSIISDSDGISYWEEFGGSLGTISNIQIYPAAGDLASITGQYRVTADDSAGNIQAGKHFSFDLTIDPSAQQGDWDYFHITNSLVPDDTIRLNVVPEPGTVFLLSLGGLIFLRKRKPQ